MKTILTLSILFCAIAFPALGELTDANLNEIRMIVNEEVKPIKADIVNLKTDVAWIRGKLEGVDRQFEGVNQRITHATNISYGLIALIVAAIAIPQILIAWRSRKDRTQEKQIEELRQEIADFRQQHVPSTGPQL